MPCTYTGSELVLTGQGFVANEVGGGSFWHGLSYLRVMNRPAPATTKAVPAMDLVGLGALIAVLGGTGGLIARRRRQG